MKTLQTIVLILTITLLIALAHKSQTYESSFNRKETTLSEAIERANREAEVYNAKHAVKPVKLYKPKSEAKRLKIIGEIWGIKGHSSETKIFTARKE